MSVKLDLEELPYEPKCSAQRLDNWSAVDRQTTITLPTWIMEDAEEWAVITDCEGDFVALVANDKAYLLCRVLNEAGQGDQRTEKLESDVELAHKELDKSVAKRKGAK